MRSPFFSITATIFAVSISLAPILRGQDVGIGSQVSDLRLSDCQGAPHDLSELQGSEATAIIFFGVECPIARLYGNRLCDLVQQYEGRVSFLGIDSNGRDDVAEIEAWGEQYAPTLKRLHDPDQVAADRIGATRNPEVVLLDRDRIIRYRGRIDDQYTTIAKKGQAVRHDLVNAIEDILAGNPVSVPITVATGCYIDRRPKSNAVERVEVTYHQHIAPILRRRCANCHRAGQSAPFELTSYDEAYSWIDTIEEVVQEKRMPPWAASPEHGDFENDAGLTASETALLQQWIDADGPEGDASQAVKLDPLPNSEWNIDVPDLVLQIPKPYTVQAAGTIEYQYFLVDPGFREDKWVIAAEVRPTNPAVVHHANVWIEHSTASKFTVESFTALASGYLAVAAPGRPPMTFPQGMAKRIPAGSKLVFQLHYQSVGSEQQDQTRLGLKFADPKWITREVATRGLIANDKHLNIPPRVEHFPVRLEQTVDRNLMLLALTPHMHLRGKSCRYELNYPDGRNEVLLEIPQWNSDWQDRYVLAKPKRIPAGTQVVATAVFDNSANNPSNPDPDARVAYGPQLTDEMFNAWYEAVLADQDLSQPAIVQLWSNAPVKKICFPLVALAAVVLSCRFLPNRVGPNRDGPNCDGNM